MKLADRSLIKRASALALAVVLAMGLTPLPAIANTPMAVEAASARTEAIFADNTSLTVDGNVEGSNNTFSVNGSVGHKIVSKGGRKLAKLRPCPVDAGANDQESNLHGSYRPSQPRGRLRASHGDETFHPNTGEHLLRLHGLAGPNLLHGATGASASAVHRPVLELQQRFERRNG